MPTPTTSRVHDSFRRTMADFGYPVDSLSDEEIDNGVLALSQAAGKFGLTVTEFGRASAAFAKAAPVAMPTNITRP